MIFKTEIKISKDIEIHLLPFSACDSYRSEVLGKVLFGSFNRHLPFGEFVDLKGDTVLLLITLLTFE